MKYYHTLAIAAVVARGMTEASVAEDLSDKGVEFRMCHNALKAADHPSPVVLP